uniref:BLUF domain-containing protein n=1 Tax=Angiostrongylus cantonensis TaxID=6313 RepID=A0A0K0DP95_ANGCA
MIRYDVIGLAETRRRHPFNAVYDTGEELFLRTCDIRGVGGVGILVSTSSSMNIDSFEQLTTRIGRLQLERFGSVPALTIVVVYAPTLNYDEEEVEAFYMVYRLGEVSQRRPYIIQDHQWRLQRQDWTKKNV